ncbi:hypothetical protein [Nannocystis punicea]|uniref:Uncharacterized protein n=1 Tax=Nannocystis punicea TaxID=2995304 RepID=A0ABY7GRX9_9BACT|nr:hypothetical protein [Nannocystis poenicansa]WAS89688.1 hypothetical protein O0S08_26135 [Nannocystis poenicansa]
MSSSDSHQFDALDRAMRRRSKRWGLRGCLAAMLVGWLSMTTYCEEDSHHPMRAEAHVFEIAHLAAEYRATQGRCPNGGLQLLAVGLARRWAVDPWGREYILECTDDWALACSLGPDGRPGRDDICSRPQSTRPRGQAGK